MTRGSAPGHVVALAVVAALAACDSRDVNPSPDQAANSRTARRIDAELAPADGAPPPALREGLAAAILIDTSGSMDRRAPDSAGETKLEVARRAAMDLVDQFAKYAADHKNEPVLLGIFEFSGRAGEDSREVVPMAPPDRDRAARAIADMRADGGTPIGSAMIRAKRALDATGLTRRHLLVVTDGENTDGHEPGDVTAAIGRRPPEERPSIYFVAFDIAANRFNQVRDAGGLVLGAATGKELGSTLDALLTGKILIEK